MGASGVTPASASGGTGGHRASLAWAALGVVALVLPVESTARWFHATYTATAADVVWGVWLLKLTLVALAIAGILLSRAPLPLSRPRNDRPADATALGLLAAILVLALGLRLYRLDTELWLDEIQLLVRYASLDFRQLLSTFDSQNHQPLYSIFASWSYHAAGGSDWSIRVPAVVFGVASIWAMWSFARRVTSTT
jgi:hypothetical protein